MHRPMTYRKDPLGQDALIAEAARWFAALDAGTVSAKAFEAWRSRDPANAVAYARVVGGWESVAGQDMPCAQAETAVVGRRWWLKAAAVAVPVAVLGSGLLSRSAYAWNTVRTGVGETRRLALPDGSIAYLNTDTSLSWRFGETARLLRLERGEVALDVKRGRAAALRLNDTSLPLAPGLFDVRVAPGKAQLTLIDGVGMHLPPVDGKEGEGLALRPNDTVVVDRGRTPRVETRSAEQAASLIAWRGGEIVFLDQSLAAAAADFNRYLPRKIVVRDAGLAREKIGGRFDLDRPDQFLQAVSLSLGAHVRTTATGYELTR